MADLNKATNIIIDAKTQYPSACNSVETILINKDFNLKEDLLKNLENAGIQLIFEPESWHKEYLDKIVSVKEVNSIEEAIEHINTYSSGHTESIITEDSETAHKILYNYLYLYYIYLFLFPVPVHIFLLIQFYLKMI